MVISVVRIVLAGIVLRGQIACRKVKEQSRPAFIPVQTANDHAQKGLGHQLFDHDPRPDTQTAAPVASSLILRQLGIREIRQEVRVRIHHFRLILTFPADRSAFGYVILFIRLIDPVILIVDIDHTLDRPLVDLPFDLGYFDFEIVIHSSVHPLLQVCIPTQ